jgi:hypothetical protein
MKSLRSREISTAVATAKEVPVPHVEDPWDTAPLVGLFRQLQQLQAQAKALGIFTDERNLLTCPNCGLFEDVTSEGFLITSRTLSKEPLDTGLRFREIATDTYCCPSCQSEVQSSNEHDEPVDSKAPTGRPYASPEQYPGSNAPKESVALSRSGAETASQRLPEGRAQRGNGRNMGGAK